MAKIRIGNAMPEWGWFEDFYDEDSLEIVTKKGNSAVYEDENGAQIVLSGTGFSYRGDRIVGGTIKSVEFLDADGKTLITVTGRYDADATTNALENNVDIWDFMSALTAGNDTIIGSKRGSSLNLGDNSGNDVVIAGIGGSFMGGSKGNDVYRGTGNQNGWDTLSYEETFWRGDDKHGIKLDASKGTVNDSWGDKDKFSNVEEFRGSVYKDQLAGSNKDNAFMGLRGDDVINGRGGTDDVRYHKDHQYNGKNGIVANLDTGIITDGFGDKDHVTSIERVFGTYKNDRFIGDNQDNAFRGISGKDSFDGGKGVDEVSFDWWENLGQHGVVVDLTRSTNQIQDDGFGNRETVKSIEALVGGDFDDRLQLGSAGGWAWGGGGDDILTAGRAGDELGGDAGSDTFVFLAASDIGTLAGAHSRIGDFQQGSDTVDLSGISGLSFIGSSGFSSTAGELRYEQSGGSTFLFGDTDGNGSSDFALELRGKITITGADLEL